MSPPQAISGHVVCWLFAVKLRYRSSFTASQKPYLRCLLVIDIVGVSYHTYSRLRSKLFYVGYTLTKLLSTITTTTFFFIHPFASLSPRLITLNRELFRYRYG